MSSSEVIATFDNTHNALRFEKALKDNQVKLTVMPVPREVSASCGLSVKFNIGDLEQVKALVLSGEIQVKRYYEIVIEEGKRRYLEK